jgi:hypothetical protein
MTLWEIINDPASGEGSRIRAAETILRYAWGEPTGIERNQPPDDLERIQFELPLEDQFLPNEITKASSAILQDINRSHAGEFKAKPGP